MESERQSGRRARILLCVVAIATLAPAEYGRQVVASYATVPEVPVRSIRNLTLARGQGRPLLDPQSLVVRDDGALLLADSGWNRVIIFDKGMSRGRVLLTVGGTPAHTRVEDLALDPDGNLWLLERKTGVVRLFDRKGRPLRNGKLARLGATGLAVDGDGNLYLAEHRKGIRKYGPTLRPATDWGASAEPSGVVAGELITGMVAAAERLFVAYGRRGNLLCLDLQGNLIASTKLRSEAGILALGYDGFVYMSDKRFNRVWRFDRECRESGRLVDSETGLNPFAQPRGTASPNARSIFVVNGPGVTEFQLTELGGADAP